MLRVAQECLANIRKHAQAHTVRVMLSCRGVGTYSLLIEDDGVGFEDPASRASRANTSVFRSWKSGHGAWVVTCASKVRWERAPGWN